MGCIATHIGALRYLPNVAALSGGVSPPSGFTWAQPFAIYPRDGTFVASPDISVFAITGKTYYVSTTGNDTNDGLTPAAPLRKISTAQKKADVDVVSIAAGVYGFTNGVMLEEPVRSMSLIATGGRVVLGEFAEGLSWALDVAGSRPNTWKAARSNIGAARDAAFPDANGDHTVLTLQADADAVEANAGSWYTDNTSVWVRTSDSREIDSDVRLYFSNVNFAARIIGPLTMYWENIDFEGGNTNAAMYVAANAGGAPTGYFKDCTFKYSLGADGMDSHGGTVYCQDCEAACNYADGFTYHASLGHIAYGVEIRCTGRHNGTAGDIDNGSTMHDAGAVVRVSGEYYANIGRNVHDVNADSQSWNVGCNAHDSASGVADVNWCVGTAGGGGEMWLDSCESSGSAVDLEIDTGATMRTRNTAAATTGTNTVNGTLETY